MKGMEYNFLKYDLNKIDHLGAGYDTCSVMHYGGTAFAKVGVGVHALLYIALARSPGANRPSFPSTKPSAESVSGMVSQIQVVHCCVVS